MAKRKTLREQRSDRLRQLQELETGKVETLRDRLVNVRTPGRIWAALERQRFFVCGYCFQRMALYSPGLVTGKEENPILYYGCSKRCEPSGVHKAEFVDNRIIEFLYGRLREKFPDAKGDESVMEDLTGTFVRLEEMDRERMSLVEALHHAGYERDRILEELTKLEDRIESIRREIADFQNKDPGKSQLLTPIFLIESAEELKNLNLLFKRELINNLVRRIRFFNETLIVNLVALDEKERRIEKEGGGKIQNIHLLYNYEQVDVDKVMADEDVVEEVLDPGKAVEKIDLDFIMTEPKETKAEIDEAERIDLDLLMTEPGSEEEEKARKKLEKTGKNVK